MTDPFALDDVLKVARRVLETEAEAVRALVDRLDQRFERAVELIETCRGRVVVTGLGKLAATLAATGTPALFLHPADGVHGDLGMLVRGDVVLALSHSGETEEILALVPAIKRLAVPLVALTGRPSSRLAQHADLVLDVSVRRLVRVAELMHRGDEMPVVPESAPLEAVIRAMSAKGLGCTGVVDAAGHLTGMVTDGDLRRAVERGVGALPPTAGGAMTRRPKTVGRAELAVTALELMERHKITQLFIVDDEGRPDGIIHLHDLLRAASRVGARSPVPKRFTSEERCQPVALQGLSPLSASGDDREEGSSAR